MAERRTFGPVVLVGLAGAGLAAVAGNEAWAAADDCQPTGLVTGTADSPATTAVALALLAAWGVLLVTRGLVRRTASVLVALLGVGLVPIVVLGAGSTRDALRDEAAGCTGVHTTGWFYVAAVAALLAVVAAVAAAVLVPRWPEMGRKYDAPVGPAPEPKAPEERENLDLWKDMDEGRDPTA